MEIDRKAMEELVRGREFANQLQQVFINGDNELATKATDPLFAGHLLNNVLNSFANTLLLLDKKHHPSTTTTTTYNNQSPQIQKRDFSFICPGPAKSEEDSEETSPAGRGCYKRRKSREAREEVSERATDDGHQWRKYGQKLILNSKYARNYYRCTHKVDQRCEATKQVQRIQEKPALYKTTYYFNHTCRSEPLQYHYHLHDNIDDHDHQINLLQNDNTSSILLSFSNNTTFPTTPTTKHDHDDHQYYWDWPLLSSSSFPSPNSDYCSSSSSSSSSKEELELVPSASASASDHHHPPSTSTTTLDISTIHHNIAPDQYSDHNDLIFYHHSSHLDDFFQPFPAFL